MILTRLLFAASIASLMGTALADDTVAGRAIYERGAPASGRAASARVGGGDAMPATLLPCVNCHGHEGRGIAEGGVVPSTITWLELTKPYFARAANGRRRPAYDARSFGRSVRDGIDPAGNRLSPAMPRYDLSNVELGDLIAYLRVLSGPAAPGVTSTSVRVATVIPRGGPPAEIGKQVYAVLRAAFEDAGQVHGRRIDLVALDAPSTPAERQRFERGLVQQPPFALVSGFDTGADGVLEAVAESSEIPLVLPLSFHSDTSASNHQRFYLYPGLEDQLVALIRFVENQRQAQFSRLIVVAPGKPPWLQRVLVRLDRPVEFELIESNRPDFQERLTRAAGVPNAAVIPLDPSFALLGPLPGNTSLLMLSALLPQAIEAIPAATWRDARIALPSLPGDVSTAGLARFLSFLDGHALARGHLPAQIAAYVAARVFLDALGSAGRDLTRPGLIAAVESINDLPTGLTQPLSFGRRRRIAVSSVQIASFDFANRRFVPLGDWPLQ